MFMRYLTCFFLLGGLPGILHANAYWNDFQYVIMENRAIITGYAGSGGVVEIPVEIEGKPVTEIGDNAFLFNTDIERVIIPEGVLRVGTYAFLGSFLLSEVSVPASVTEIGHRAFGEAPNLVNIDVSEANPEFAGEGGLLFSKDKTILLLASAAYTGEFTVPDFVEIIWDSAFYGNTGLTEVVIPEGITHIEEAAFFACTGLQQIHLPNSLETIGDRAFMTTFALESVTLPGNVSHVGDGAFARSTALADIFVAGDNEWFSSVDGVLFDKSETVLRQYPGNRSGPYTIPTGVVEIANKAFWYAGGLSAVDIPSTVRRIGSRAFANTPVTAVGIPSSVEILGERAFGNCHLLTRIEVAAENAWFSSDDGILLDKHQSVLIQFPSGRSGGYVLPDTVVEVANHAFSGAGNLSSLALPEGLKKIGQEAFFFCASLPELEIPSTVEEIATRAFANSGMRNIVIPHGVLSIADETFRQGVARSITLPPGIESIGSRAFCGARSLAAVYFEGNAPAQLEDDIFDDARPVVYYFRGTEGWGSVFAGRPTYALNPPDLWINAEPSEDGWLNLNGFGKFLEVEGQNWIFHAEHGWIYVTAEGAHELWIYDANLGTWMWSALDTYPWFFLPETEAVWLHYELGGLPGQRIFYDVVDDRLLHESSLLPADEDG